jgi:hypothetical protein
VIDVPESPPSAASPSSPSLATRVPWPLVAFALSLALYAATLAPGVAWGDSAALATKVRRMYLRVGTAGDHPLFVVLGGAVDALPGDLGFKLNLLSALFAAATVALAGAIARKLTGSVVAGLAASAALAVAHAFWFHAVLTEVYTLDAMFLALVLWLLLEWRSRGGRGPALALAALAFVVGLTNHLVLATVLPAAALCVAITRPSALRGKAAMTVAGLGAMAVTAAWLAVPAVRAAALKLWYGPPAVYHYFWLPGDLFALARETAVYGVLLAYQFAGIGLVLGLAGVRVLWKRDRGGAAVLLAAMLAGGLFFVKTIEWNAIGSTKYTFYIHDYVVFAVFVGVGAAALVESAALRRARLLPASPPLAAAAVVGLLVAGPVLTYALTPALLRTLDVDPLRTNALPHRDALAYFLTPSKRGDDGPARFAEEALRSLPQGAVLVADYSPHKVLQYMQVVRGLRPDVVLADSTYQRRRVDLGRIHWPARRVFLAGRDPRYYDLASVGGDFGLVAAGILTEIVPSRSRVASR